MCKLVLHRFLVALLLLGSLGGCAYRPLYGKHTAGGDVVTVLRSIAVVEQTTRVGQVVRNELISALGGVADAPQFTLRLVVSEGKVGVSSLSGTTVTRVRYHVAAGYTMLETSTGRQVTFGNSTSAISYDTNLEPIADLQSAETARNRAAREVAQDIKLRLSAFVAAGQ
jgi:LPS-assembly lipoprotein